MPREDVDANDGLTTLADRFGNLVAWTLFDQRLTEFFQSLRVLDREPKGHAVCRIFRGGEVFLRLRLNEIREGMDQPLLHFRNENLWNNAR